MSRLRVSIVQYLNTAPLVWGFTNGPLKGRYDLSFTIPSQCAEALRSGVADVAIIPAIEYQRIENLVALPDLAIAAQGRVRSLLLIAKKPIEQVREVALDRGSRSTQTMTRILCADLWNIAPEFFEADPVLQSMLRDADAALLIGDPALRLSLAIENASRPSVSGTLTCKGSTIGIPELDSLFIYDIVEEWRRATNLPAVLAVWAARSNVVTADVVQDFLASRDYGVGRIGEISEAAAQEFGLPAPALASYLRVNIDYGLSTENLRGLEHYYARAAALGLTPAAKPVAWAMAPALTANARAKVQQLV